LKKRDPSKDQWTPEERALFASLASPFDIQTFLDGVAYSADEYARSPRSVMRDRKANCYDGALFAAAALAQLGLPPLLVDLRAVNDDDHVLAVFQRRACWGAIAKSNFVGLRYREPIHKTLRELAVSYFNDYFNTAGEKTLRSYSTALNLARFDRLRWATSEENLDELADHLDSARHMPIASAKQVAEFVKIDERTLKAALVGAVKAGLYKAK